MKKHERVPFKMEIRTGQTLGAERIHEFIYDFTTRYASRISKGEDMRYVFNYEMTLFEEGIVFFELDSEYTNRADITVRITGREEGFIFFEYGGECYKSDSFWIEDGVEYMVAGDIMWSSVQHTKETVVDEGVTEEEETV